MSKPSAWYIIYMERLLTPREKSKIRAMPCGRCGEKPPSQCHRIIPESKGGRYTKRNTVPRCPKCHAKEPGHSPSGFIMLTMMQRRTGGHRTRERHPDMARAIGRRVGPKSGPKNFRRAWELRPEYMREIARRAGRRSRALHPENGFAKYGRKALHVRWHVRRRRKNPRCKFCQQS